MDVPCFTTSTDIPWRDPSLLLREDLILAQMTDPDCSRLLTDVGVHPQLDVDEFGVLGRVLPSGEFQVTIPPISNEVPLPVAVFEEVPLPPETADVIGDEDAPILRRGYQSHLTRQTSNGGFQLHPSQLRLKFPPSSARLLSHPWMTCRRRSSSKNSEGSRQKTKNVDNS
jgi:hypothetical protein